jgi:hypothetical protein|tara:strand:- start:548 stop:1675 length:1128 start_codon:yes stop_codon:yes gene_type:complete
MATSFKTFDPTKDSVVTRNLLHEAIPITGTIISGTYADNNIKNYAHGMFQSVYDYPFLSSSANHIFDITLGFPATSSLSRSYGTTTQQAKKINLYNQMAQVLAGYDANGAIRRFDEDGDLTGGTKIDEAYFINFTRLLSKDEIKKGSFSLKLNVGAPGFSGFSSLSKDTLTISDKDGTTSYKVNSPAGEYGILYATGSGKVWNRSVGGYDTTWTNGYAKVGLIYYQAGIVVLSSSAFGSLLSSSVSMSRTEGVRGPAIMLSASVDGNFISSSISGNCDNLRHRIQNVSFNNSTELNSTVYFCRANNTDFNYSSNPTYLSSSKIVVKNNSQDVPVSYVTSVGLYSADNELLAVSKLSEPLKKDPTTEFTIRVRLDY